MKTATTTAPDFFGTAPIRKILFRIAPPVMLAQLIQALYNIVDSYFVGRYSDDALTAVTVIYPLQLVMIALAVGTGVGVNTYMARKYAQERERDARATAGTGMVLALSSWAVVAIASVLVMRPYVNATASSPAAVEYAVTYGRIVTVGGIGLFLEGNWSKVLQARGDMKRPMIAQVVGAAINVVFDPLLIFGIGFFPELGVAGAAWATILGQMVAAAIVGARAFYMPPKLREIGHFVGRIYHYGYSSIFMQMMYSVYIFALNVILAGFSDSAVTVLGLYYKAQSFFFIPLFGLQTCIVPVISYNFARDNYLRCRETMRESLLISLAFMTAGFLCFVFLPEPMMRVFSNSAEVIAIGKIAFPIIGTSFFPAVTSLMLPVFFQAIGDGRRSLFATLTRQIFCLVPIFWLFSLIGLNYTWISFPASETITTIIGAGMYVRQLHQWGLTLRTPKKTP